MKILMSHLSVLKRLRYWYIYLEYHSVTLLVYSVVIILIASATLTYNKAVSDENFMLRRENEIIHEEMSSLRSKYKIEHGKYILASSQLQPFKELSRKMYPDSSVNKSLERLHNELLRSKFTPLDKNLVDDITSKLKIIKEEVGDKDILFKITFEPWANPELIKFAEQIKVILNSAGINAMVESNNVYLFELPVPVEWGGNGNNNEFVSKMISAFEPVFVDASNHMVRISKRFPKDFIRMHIAGYIQFEPTGIVSVY